MHLEHLCDQGPLAHGNAAVPAVGRPQSWPQHSRELNFSSIGSTPPLFQQRIHPYCFRPVVIRYRPPLDARADAWFITVDRIGDQHFTFRVNEFPVCYRQVKQSTTPSSKTI